MEAKQLIEEYLKTGGTRMMQLATSVNNKPWCSTVYYAVDSDLNLIWISLPSRRHSKEVAINANIAGAIAFDQQPPQPYVRGIQFEGTAEMLAGNQEKAACRMYVNQLNRKDDLYGDIHSGKNPHRVYRLNVKKYVLFDSKNFPKDPRKEWTKQ